MTTEVSTNEVLAALRASHDRFAAGLAGLDAEQVAGPSYDDDWSVAQVASHLSSGAEIFGLFLQPGLTGDPAPGMEAFQAIWARWDAKSPADQARDSVAANEHFLDEVTALSDGERDRWRLDVFGAERTLSEFLQMRLGEHALHTWDILVMTEPDLGVPDDATAIVVDNVSLLADRAGQPSDEQHSVEVRTTTPERAYRLDLGPDGVRLTPSSDDTAAAALTLSAEAFIRLVYGRLDVDHTPVSVSADGVDLDLLRRTFPGV